MEGRVMSASTACPTDPVVLSFVEGDLAGDEELAVSRHLGGCPECRDRAVEYRELAGALRTLTPSEAVRWHAFDSPLGPTFAALTDRGLARLSWTHEHDAGSFSRQLEGLFPGRPVIRDAPALRGVQWQLEEYFAGRRSTFDVPVDLSVVSDFEQEVLSTLQAQVRFGEVIPYAELARRMGRPGAARAVGNALGRNPVAIVVPCHRVIRSDGSLGGYTGGIEFKRHLLSIEGREDLLRTG